MAIDTANKRRSCLCLALPFRSLPVPDATVDKPDRKSLGRCYNGIASTSPALADTAIKNNKMLPNVIRRHPSVGRMLGR